jgi:hypothetical protein
MNKPDQSASVVFQVHDGSIFLSFSVNLDRSSSSFLFYFFFYFFLCFFFFNFPFPFLSSSFSRRLQKEKRSECQLMAQFAAKYEESNRGPRPLREFPGNYHGKYASSSVGRVLNKYTHSAAHRLPNKLSCLEACARTYMAPCCMC